ncbi:hypothetical protein GJ744_006232 [Endocarpon pusillum]|uniref:Uncharacterized protein n=1 Tax=Endocarpon pusillum TaxID=364733 RepID=A0A8H7AT12_9EURO|nr:hypothetical protein GJ744_006232 [Endocarpon pusillum]
MIIFNRHVSLQAYRTFLVFLKIFPTVRADYSSFLFRLYQAFSKFNVKVPDSAISDVDLLNTHLKYLGANLSKWDEAIYNDTLSEDESQKEMDEASKGYIDSFYHVIGDYMGVGVQRAADQTLRRSSMKPASGTRPDSKLQP